MKERKMSDFYYRRMTGDEQKHYRRILAELNHLGRFVKIKDLSRNAFLRLIESVKFDHPELFYVDYRQIQMTEYTNHDITWNIKYLYSVSEIKARKQALETVVKTILKSLGGVEQESAARKAQWIHDKLVRNVEYDVQAAQNARKFPMAYTVEGVFEKRKAVCQGIALAVILLGDYLGMDIGFVEGIGLSDEIGLNDDHGWNLVNLGNGYAHLDVTWDICLSREIRYTRYDYFLIPDEDILADHVITRVVNRADVRSASYFAQTRRNFQSMAECRQFIRTMLMAGRRNLYFRYRRRGESSEETIQNFVAMITETMHQISMDGFQIEMCNNEARDIFYYKVK